MVQYQTGCYDKAHIQHALINPKRLRYTMSFLLYQLHVHVLRGVVHTVDMKF